MDHVALGCVAALGLLLFGLGMAVSMVRFRRHRIAGHAGDPSDLLHKLIRAHGNTAEYAPFFAILFLYLGARSPSAATLALIVAATVCRFALVLGLVVFPTMAKANPLRFIGALGTYATGIALCARLLGESLAR